jgi:hypothetical protein
MDRHINMSWCEFPAFRTLAKNNLDLEWHDLFPEIEEAFVDKAIAPANVSEILLKKKRKPTAALIALLEALSKAPSVSEKPAVKIDFEEILLTGATTEDEGPVSPASVDSKALSDHKGEANGTTTTMAEANGPVKPEPVDTSSVATVESS